MKILHVVPGYAPAWRYGGPAHSVHGLCAALVRQGHEVEVFTTDANGSETLDVESGVPTERDGVRVTYFPVGRLRRFLRSAALERALHHEVERFDLVHLHTLFSWSNVQAARAARGAHVPCAVSPRGMLVHELIERRGTLRKKLWLKWFDRPLLEQAALVHVTSEVEARELLAAGLEPGKIVTVPNGVEVLGPPPRSHEVSARLVELTSERPYLLFLGRLSWKKGLDRLIDALAAVDVRLILAGPDDEGIAARLLERATRVGVREQVRWIGLVHGNDKRWLLSRAEALVLPSSSENYGNVVIEALAEGTPAITTPGVGASGVLRASESGLVAFASAQALARCLKSFLDLPVAARASMGRRGQAHVARHLGWDSLARAMHAAYARTLERSATALG